MNKTAHEPSQGYLLVFLSNRDTLTYLSGPTRTGQGKGEDHHLLMKSLSFLLPPFTPQKTNFPLWGRRWKQGKKSSRLCIQLEGQKNQDQRLASPRDKKEQLMHFFLLWGVKDFSISKQNSKRKTNLFNFSRSGAIAGFYRSKLLLTKTAVSCIVL